MQLYIRKKCQASFCRCELTLMDFVLDPGDQDLKEYTLEKKYMLLGSNFKNIIFKTVVGKSVPAEEHFLRCKITTLAYCRSVVFAACGFT